MVPTTRADFKEYVLRKLGKPVIEINVDEDQIDDRVDEALKFYADYHFDGSEKQYYKHQLVADDFTNKYITLPENIMGVVQIFDTGFGSGVGNMFNIKYQIALNDLYTLTNTSVVPYYMTMQHLALLEEIFSGKMPIRYTRHRNRLHIDGDWSRFQVGQYIVVECYEVIDPTTFSDVWGDRWLQNYAVALIGQQWGNNLTKFSGMQLPGGVQFNGDQILERYTTQREKLEDEMINSYSIPVLDMIG